MKPERLDPDAIRGTASHFGPNGKPKEGWLRRREARQRMRFLERKHGTELHLYRCGSCLLFHFASGPRWREP